jgi:hypothetical protein
MSNYVPHYTKKCQVRRKKEECLRRLICQGAEKKKLLNAAEELRLARIRVLNAKKATIPPNYGPQDKRAAHIDGEIAALQQISAEAILVEFGHAIPD